MAASAPPRSSTSKVKISQFAPHGQVDMWMDGKVLHYEAMGPFNRELVDCLAVAQTNFLQNLTPQGPWASICTIKGSAMATPDSLQRYDELMRTAKGPGLSPAATAFVMAPGVEGAKIMAIHFAKIFAGIGRPFQAFENMAEAEHWAMGIVAQAGKPA